MNDPNCPIHCKGKYHMFFQYNPHDAVSGDMHWDHAVSDDMIHWRHMPVAMTPTAGGPDQEGVLSGTAFIQDGNAGMMYTVAKKSTRNEAMIKDSSLRETQCIAMANDDELYKGSFKLVIEGDRSKETWMAIEFDPAHPDSILIRCETPKTLAEHRWSYRDPSPYRRICDWVDL